MTMKLAGKTTLRLQVWGNGPGWPRPIVGFKEVEVHLHMDIDKIMEEYAYRAVKNKAKKSRILNGTAVLVCVEEGEVQPLPETPCASSSRTGSLSLPVLQPPSGDDETGDPTK